ncbi:MAG: Ankyrin-2 [Geoglossum simile]|nr:MAG: Ankyrin-2 [Geoglossum simile]
MEIESSGRNYEHRVYDEKGKIPFRTVDFLGYGASGHVDKVERISGPRKGQIYARKLFRLPVEDHQQEQMQTSIQREVDIAKSAHHAHVVRLIETYRFKSYYAIIMHPVAEKNLHEYLHETDSTPLDHKGQELRERIPSWFECLINGMAYLHLQQIRHRDLKPSNILVADGKVLLADFGISKVFPEDTRSGPTETRGTAIYRPPELAVGRQCGRRGDIFSLGAVFLEMLTVYSGHKQLMRFREFRQSDDDRTYVTNADKVFEWMDSLSYIFRDVPWYLTILSLCRNMLRIERDERPIADDLRSCWSYQPSLAVPPMSCKFCLSPDASSQYPIRRINEALRKASKEGHKLAVCLLIERGATANDGVALRYASAGGFEVIVQVLIEKGVNIEAKDEHGKAALHMAAKHGHETVVQLLVKKGASITTKDNNGCTALHLAARYGLVDVVQLLVKERANIAAKSNDGSTALHSAARYGRIEVVQLLMKKRADTAARNSDGCTALHLAARYGHEEVVRLLAEKRANVEAKNNDGWTALHLATRYVHEKVVQLLAEMGANMSAKSNDGWTALHVAARYGCGKMIKLLAENGADVNMVDDDGRTALLLATQQRHEETIRLLNLYKSTRTSSPPPPTKRGIRPSSDRIRTRSRWLSRALRIRPRTK